MAEQLTDYSVGEIHRELGGGTYPAHPLVCAVYGLAQFRTVQQAGQREEADKPGTSLKASRTPAMVRSSDVPGDGGAVWQGWKLLQQLQKGHSLIEVVQEAEEYFQQSAQDRDEIRQEMAQCFPNFQHAFRVLWSRAQALSGYSHAHRAFQRLARLAPDLAVETWKTLPPAVRDKVSPETLQPLLGAEQQKHRQQALRILGQQSRRAPTSASSRSRGR